MPVDEGIRHVTVGAGSTLGGEEPVISDAVAFGSLLLLSGRAPVDPQTMAVVEGGFELQARAVLDDVGAVLRASGSSWERVLRVECYLAGAEHFPAWNALWSERFRPPRPARTTVVAGFTVPGMLVELQVTAALDRESGR
jgi:2-iminobutanoate/2-iminopropanoate deaminase